MKKDNIVIDIRKNEFRDCVWEGAIYSDRNISLKQINFLYVYLNKKNITDYLV